jgi:1-aminocyclopropane-1-carboxylate deaminase/D-cysteine desulfhydrase-like pyridoxal-dependent ACC family enzyme
VSTHATEVARGCAAVRAALDRLPRVDLGVGETPLEPLPRLTAELGGPQLYIKRDDVAGGPLGGNKTRMLEYVLGKAVEGGATSVVGGSAAQSNYSRQLAAACARLGLDCHLVLRRLRPGDEQLQGSLLLDHLYGATIEFVDDDRTEQTRRLTELADGLEAAGAVVYRAPQASEADKALHAAAYAGAAVELLEQCAVAGVEPTHVYVSTLDTTHAGLLLGLRTAESGAEVRAISPNERAIFTDRTIEEEVARLTTAAGQLLGLSVAITADDVVTSTAHLGVRYGDITAGGVAAMRVFARTEAIILDPVYTAKAAAALIDDVESGVLGKSDVVVFWHTGGMPAVFAYSDEIGAA